MIVFERSFDFDLIGEILRHPRVYPFISDDSSPAREAYQPPCHPSLWYVLVHNLEDGRKQLLGLFLFVPQNGICWEVHTALLPCAWGELAHAASRLLPDWIWANTTCRRIVTNVPRANRLALSFAIRAGMKMFGVNEASYMKDGKLCDQVMLGISPGDGTMPDFDIALTAKEEEACQPQP